MGKTITAVRFDVFANPVKIRFLAKTPRGVRYVLRTEVVDVTGLDRTSKRDAIGAAIEKHIPARP